MENYAATKPRYFTRSRRNTSVLSRFPLILVEAVYVWYFFTQTDSAVQFVCITILTVIHADLYAMEKRIIARRRLMLPYLYAQFLLLLMISAMTNSWFLPLGFYGALVLKIVELLERTEAGLARPFGYFLLYASGGYLDLCRLIANQRVNWFYLLPLVICLAANIPLFLRQIQACKELQRQLRDQQRSYDELLATHAELAAAHAQLGAHLVELEELTLSNERQRLARELHDTLTQGLVSLIWQLEALEARLVDGQAQRAREIAQLAMQGARTTLGESRRAIHALRSGASEIAVQGASLSETAQAEIQRFNEATGIVCRSDLRLLEAMPVPVGQQAMQAIKEGLTNVARHAHASEVWVGVSSNGAVFELEIRDDGRGFDPQRIAAGHYGLLGLRERAQQLGGDLDIRSVPGKGTRLQMSLPCTRAEREVCTV